MNVVMIVVPRAHCRCGPECTVDRAVERAEEARMYACMRVMACACLILTRIANRIQRPCRASVVMYFLFSVLEINSSIASLRANIANIVCTPQQMVEE
jgi:hypothetical protein